MSRTVGVTIAVGAEYERLAAIATARFQEFTGCGVVILTEQDFRASGLRHPSQLKFRLFDLVDAEQVVYFDADAFVMQRWNVDANRDPSMFQATRAFWFEPWVARLGTLYGFEDRVVCSGVFLAQRTDHAAAFRLAERLQPASDEFLGHFNAEEIALSLALHLLKIPIAFLDRRFNWVQYGRGDLAARADVIRCAVSPPIPVPGDRKSCAQKSPTSIWPPRPSRFMKRSAFAGRPLPAAFRSLRF